MTISVYSLFKITVTYWTNLYGVTNTFQLNQKNYSLTRKFRIYTYRQWNCGVILSRFKTISNVNTTTGSEFINFLWNFENRIYNQIQNSRTFSFTERMRSKQQIMEVNGNTKVVFFTTKTPALCLYIAFTAGVGNLRPAKWYNPARPCQIVQPETYELDNTAFLKWCAALAFCIFTTCFFGFLHNSLFTGICKIGYGDQRQKKKKGQRLKKKKKVKDRKHREKEDENRKHGARLKNDKTKNAED